MVYNEIIGLGILSKANKQEIAMGILEVKSKSIILVNIVLMAVLGLLTVWSYKSENMFNAALPVIVSSSLLVFDITTNNIVNQNKSNIILNTLIFSLAYLVIYNMILLIFSFDIEFIVKLLSTQIFLMIYSIARFFSKNMKIVNKAIFYLLFFTMLTSLGIYAYYKNFKLIDISVFSASIASVISALYIGIVSFMSRKINY